MDPYLLLEVPSSASNSDIKKAYHKMALKWHPDKNGGSKDAEEKSKQINAAYECLTDPGKRAALDANRLDQEKAEAAKKAKAKAEADRQARARAYAQTPPPGRSDISPLATVLAVIAFIFIIVALFGSNNGGSGSASA
ncbi:MAG: DnaJ domain-containing protein [Flavobacteriales bacterium]